ncbi:MAG: penicillin-binding protein 2 [Candidatus Andersenbacteria bacterium]
MGVSFNPQQRIALLILGGLALFGILIARVAYLQVVQHGRFTAIAEAQRKRASELQPHRGTIYLTEGREGDIFPIASNRAGYIAFAVPRGMEDPTGVAEQLAPALYEFRRRQQERIQAIVDRTGQERIKEEEKEVAEEEQPEPTPTPTLSPEEDTIQIKVDLLEKFNQRTDPYEPFLRPHELLDDQLKAFLEEKAFRGIIIEEQEVRIYPEGELAAHAVGYVGMNDSEQRIGRYGVEGYFDELLRGDLGWLSGERAAAGGFIGVAKNEFRPAEDGADVVLTIDRVVQSFIERELKDGVERYGAERGSVLVMNPQTGAVLGMATYPTFDPNTYYAVRDARVQSNPIVNDIFEPGSILKPVIMAGAINDDIIQPDTTFTDSGPVKVAEYTINTFDGKHYGVQTMTQVLEQSNNVGMVWLSKLMGAETMYDYLRRFGLGERTGIELEGETQTNLEEPHDWDIVQTATTSFGQGVAMTPLQALNAINVIANNGKLLTPHIVSRVRYSDGTVQEANPEVVRQVVSENAASKVSAMMVSVLENGVAGLARVPGYYLAGKTGTAQVPDERGKYSADRKIISFAGFGPVEKPQFSILIKLDNPSGLSFASGTAAPMFRNISEKLLNYYQIPPSYDDGIRQPAFKVSSGQ